MNREVSPSLSPKSSPTADERHLKPSAISLSLSGSIEPQPSPSTSTSPGLLDSSQSAIKSFSASRITFPSHAIDITIDNGTRHKAPTSSISMSPHSNGMSLLPTISETAIMPFHIKRGHIMVSTAVFFIALVGIIVCSLIPLLHTQNTDDFATADPSKEKVHAKFGFRTAILLIYSTINAMLILMPYLIWYSKSCKISDMSQKDLPLAQRTLYYSYSIKEGPAKNIATMGIATSAMLYSLIIAYRYEFLEQNAFVKNSQATPNYAAVVAMLVIGLLSRVAASGVATYPVEKKTKHMHYFWAGTMFLLIGVYMLIETFAVDNMAPEGLWNFDAKQMVIRTMMTGIYWFMAIWAVLFSHCELMLFSSAAEVCAMLASELYLLTYLSTFMLYDGANHYFEFKVLPDI